MLAINIREKYQDKIKEIVCAAHRLAELGYVTSSGGNLSVRTADNLILITPTKTPKRVITEEDICAVDLDGNTVYAPQEKKPTGETPFHTRIFRKRPDVTAVVHAHPPLLTGFAIAGSDILSRPILPEPMIEVGPALLVEYATPLGDELAERFDKALDLTNCYLMENHGVTLVCPTGVFDAVEQLQMMECMAQSALVAMGLNNFKSIPTKYVKEMDGVLSQRELKIPGATGKFKSITDLYGLGGEK